MKDVAELRGSLQPFARGAVVTTSHFSKAAIREASEPGKNPIVLLDGQRFAALISRTELIGMDAQENNQEEVENFNDTLKSSRAYMAAISTTLTEVIDAAVRDISADPEYPDTPPETWQMLFVLL